MNTISLIGDGYPYLSKTWLGGNTDSDNHAKRIFLEMMNEHAPKNLPDELIHIFDFGH